MPHDDDTAAALIASLVKEALSVPSGVARADNQAVPHGTVADEAVRRLLSKLGLRAPSDRGDRSW